MKKYYMTFAGTLLAIILVGCSSSGNGNGDIARSYLKACYEEDAKEMVSLVPSAVIDDILSEYKCTKKQLVEAVEIELSNESKDYSDCSVVSTAHFMKDIEENNFDDFFDRRVEIDTDKISAMQTYQVDVSDNQYYSNLSVFKYGSKWYSVDAANFVAYAVWEKY